MYKEIIICIVLVVLIFIGNYITQKYTKESIFQTTESLEVLREELMKEDINKEEVNKKIDEISKEWSTRHEILSYFIEHDELEKVKDDLIGLNSYIEVEEYTDAISELDRGIFVLNHIEEKNKFNLKNIF